MLKMKSRAIFARKYFPMHTPWKVTRTESMFNQKIIDFNAQKIIAI